ncbi:MAG TPA: hypothetical protein VMT20_25500 [Terriglobia bacterium]|nr:hypothetical protein [Terriglobia bacterium]
MSWEVRLSSNPGGKTIAFHPKRLREAGVRVDGDHVIVMWTGGQLVLRLSELPSGWQGVNDGSGDLLPIKVKRSGLASVFGVKAIDVKFT